MKSILPQLVLFSVAAALPAHDMYVMPSTFFPTPGSPFKVGFHVGDSFPESEVSGRIERLRDPRLTWKGGSRAIGNLRVEDKRDLGDATLAAGGEAIASVSTQPNLIELEPGKFAEYLKEEGLTQILEWRAQHGESSKPGKERYSKYAKAVLLSAKPDGFARSRVGFIIEILLEADPYTLKPGDKLPIQVVFRGKPAPGLQIESSWWIAGAPAKTETVGRTGVDGRLKVPLQAVGKWRLHTIKMERCADPAVADWESFWASATFELASSTPQAFTRSLECPTGDCPLLTGLPQTAGMRSGFVSLKPGGSVGWHSTDHHEESLVILRGQGEAVLEGQSPRPLFGPGFAYVPPQTRHNVRNTGSSPLEYVYVVAPAR